jgi:mono/diheme cytochrome c family protein
MSAALVKNSSERGNNMQTKMKKLGTLVLAGALMAGAGLFSAPAKADTAAGEALFKAKCSACHGADGKGKAAMKTHDWTSAEIQKMSDADLAAAITNGKPPIMPPFKSLTADQVKDLVSFIRSLKK